MLKKILVSTLAVSVLGAGAAAAYYQYTETAVQPQVGIGNNQPANIGQANNQPVQQQNSVENVGAPWSAEGEILSLDDFGMQFRTQAGEEMYIELGPPEFWQTQGVELYTGQLITIQGFVNEGMYHAYQVMLQDGQTLTVRDEFGQPLWSGGIDNGQGQNGQQNTAGDSSGTPQPQAQVDEWLTLTGTLIDVRNGMMTIQTEDGQVISFKTGQPRFFQDQGITFAVGDQVSVVGFYEGGNFSAGDITQLSTGLRVMLRDPNGRPLWAGPSGNGNGGDH